MSASAGAPSGGSPERTEPRERVVHLVEYSRFPRRERGDARRIAYTQDRSDSGLGLDLPEPVSPGELLQVSLRDIDGLHSVDGLARVVWCRVVSGGRARAGLAMLREKGQQPMMRVRRGTRAALTN